VNPQKMASRRDVDCPFHVRGGRVERLTGVDRLTALETEAAVCYEHGKRTETPILPEALRHGREV
jgi:hypothetical protein